MLGIMAEEIIDLEPKEESELISIKNLLLRSINYRKTQGEIIFDMPGYKINILNGNVAINNIQKGISHSIVSESMILMGYVTSLYLFEKNFKNVPFLSELFGKNVEESLLAADFKVKKNGNKTDFIFNPLSILTPGKTRNFFDIWE